MNDFKKESSSNHQGGGEIARLEMFQNTRCVVNVVKTMVRHFAEKKHIIDIIAIPHPVK